MPVEVLLDRLEGVHRRGHSYRADCPNPVHSKARGSLSITEADDGRILLVCFACHDTPGILSALGLEMADLFPDRVPDLTPEGRQRARADFKRNAVIAALGVVAREATIVEIAGAELVGGYHLSDADHARLVTACSRIERAREVLR